MSNGWKMRDIDEMDMLGYLKIQVWKAGKNQRKSAPVARYIDEVWNMKPGM